MAEDGVDGLGLLAAPSLVPVQSAHNQGAVTVER
jgi:hypothetical protein